MQKMIILQVTLFVLIAVGFFLKKKGIFGTTGQKNLTDLVIYVVLPCNIVNAFMVDFSMERLYACAGILLRYLELGADPRDFLRTYRMD